MNDLKKADKPFIFHSQFNLVEMTGWTARNLKELLNHLKKSPGPVIYHHTHHFLKQHQFLSPEPTNDFAYWVTNVLQEDKLGEQLAAIDTVGYTTSQALGDKIIAVIEKHGVKGKLRQAPDGEEFYFMKSQGFVFPTSHQASDLVEFEDGIKKSSIFSLYHHIFDARMRIGRRKNDFSFWLDDQLKETELANDIGKLDPYTQTLENLRTRILQLVRKKLESKK